MSGATAEQLDGAIFRLVRPHYKSDEHARIAIAHSVQGVDNSLFTLRVAAAALVPEGKVIAPAADVISPELKAAMARAAEFIGAVEDVMKTICDDDAYDALGAALWKVCNDVGILISASEQETT